MIGYLENEITASQRVSKRVSYKRTRNALHARSKRENCHVYRNRYCTGSTFQLVPSDYHVPNLWIAGIMCQCTEAAEAEKKQYSAEERLPKARCPSMTMRLLTLAATSVWVNFQCRRVLLIWIIVGQGPIAPAVGAGGGCLDIFFSRLSFSFLSPFLWETARYRLKYCLKGPLNPKQPTNQPTSIIAMAALHNCSHMVDHCTFSLI